MDDLALASEFPAATREAWVAAAERVLKGADIERRLVGRTADGLRIEPVYPKSEARSLGPTRPAAPWRVAARVDHPEPLPANTLALADLDGGADALTLVFASSATARGFGLRAVDVAELDRALAGVMLDLVAVQVEAGRDGRGAAALVVALAERRGHALADLDLDLSLDPIGAAARAGSLSASWDAAGDQLSRTLADLAGQGFRGRLATADGRPYHEAGASEAQELAASLATAVAYLRALEAGGHALEAARDALSFTLVADADEFLTVAKLRALRRLWSQVELACGLVPAPIRLHAETAWRMTTRRDPWVNLLRGTLAAFSAGIGGADSIAVLPFTAALGLPDAFARRLARNTQLILLDESNLWRVADPTAGSGAFEGLTQALAERAWALFQEIEGEGGIVRSLASGRLQGRIAEVRVRREAAVATRRDPLTGTSEFPNIHEAPVTVLLPMAKADPHRHSGAAQRNPEPTEGRQSGGDPHLVRAAGSGFSPAGSAGQASPGTTKEVPNAGFEALPSMRSAEPYETLRDLSDLALVRTGSRPRVFLANLGPIAAFTARSQFARNAFEAGGIEAVTNDGFASHAAMTEAFRASGASLACLCSSDAIYEVEAEPAAAALKEAGARRLYLAGAAGPSETARRRAGIDEFLHVGSDLPALLGGLFGEGTS